MLLQINKKRRAKDHINSCTKLINYLSREVNRKINKGSNVLLKMYHRIIQYFNQSLSIFKRLMVLINFYMAIWKIVTRGF